MSENERKDSKSKKKQEIAAKFNKNLQNNELLTLHYLGLPYMVLCRQPQLRLTVPLSSQNYQSKVKARGIALQLIFTCPTNYPLQMPHIDLAERRNVSAQLEIKLRAQISHTCRQHLGLYMIVPVVSHVQMLINNELQR